MTIKSVETILEPNPGNDYCEDVLGYVDNLFWVIDGATGLYSERIYEDYRTDAEALANYLSEGIILNKSNGNLKDILGGSIEYSMSKTIQDLKDYRLGPSASVILARINLKDIEVFRLGDAEIYYDQTGYHDFCLSHQNLDKNTLMLISQLKSDSENYKESRLELIRNARNKMNTPNGYWVATPDGLGLEHGKYETFLNLGGNIYLWSDGFGCLFNNYQYNLGYVDGKGLNEVGRLIRDIEGADPRLEKYSRFKQHDDMAAIKIGIEGKEHG